MKVYKVGYVPFDDEENVIIVGYFTNKNKAYNVRKGLLENVMYSFLEEFEVDVLDE